MIRDVHWAGQPMGPTSRRFFLLGYPTQHCNLHTSDQVNPAQGEQTEPNGSQCAQLQVFTMDDRDLQKKFAVGIEPGTLTPTFQRLYP